MKTLHIIVYFLTAMITGATTAIVGGNAPEADPDSPTIPVINYPHQIQTSGKLLNISSRGSIGGNENRLIVGFVVNEGHRAALVRAIGAGLSQYAVEDHATDPEVVIRDSEGNVVATGVPISELNDTEFGIISDTSNRVGAFPIVRSSNDVAILLLLEPGPYTCSAESATGNGGEILVEVYDVPPDLIVPGP
ncbi:MAG: hypothetical protein SynsKO_26540 [Synoicihabitans sp.]